MALSSSEVMLSHNWFTGIDISKIIFKLVVFLLPFPVSPFKEMDFSWVCLFFNGLIFISVKTASWSLTPGITVQ